DDARDPHPRLGAPAVAVVAGVHRYGPGPAEAEQQQEERPDRVELALRVEGHEARQAGAGVAEALRYERLHHVVEDEGHHHDDEGDHEDRWVVEVVEDQGFTPACRSAFAVVRRVAGPGPVPLRRWWSSGRPEPWRPRRGRRLQRGPEAAPTLPHPSRAAAGGAAAPSGSRSSLPAPRPWPAAAPVLRG